MWVSFSIPEDLSPDPSQEQERGEFLPPSLAGKGVGGLGFTYNFSLDALLLDRHIFNDALGGISESIS